MPRDTATDAVDSSGATSAGGSTPTGDRAPFEFGVASGDVGATSAVVWTAVRVEPHREAPIVRCRVIDETTGAEVHRSEHTVERPAGSPVDAVPLTVPVDGLVAARRHRYHFETIGDAGRGASGVEGVFDTLPSRPVAGGRGDGPPDAVRIGLACCARLPDGPLAPYRELAEADPHLVVHLGDYVYEDSDDRHEPTHSCVTLDDYRSRYAQYRRSHDLQELHARTGWIHLWDDHEIADDTWSDGHPGVDDRVEFTRRRSAARRARDEWLPVRHSWPATDGAIERGPGHTDRLVRIGDLVDVIVLDSRHHGRAAPSDPWGPSLVEPDDDRPILTDDQWAWLASCVAGAPGWIVLCTQTQVSPLVLARLPSWRARGRTRPLVNPGQWDGYPVERRRLADLLGSVAERTLICSGDLHGRFVTSLDTADGRVPEITTPAVSTRPFARTIQRRAPIPTPLLVRWLRWINPHVESLDPLGHGTTFLDVTRDTLTVTALTDGRSETVLQFRRGTGST